MESKISIAFPFESKEEFEANQKRIIREIFEEKLNKTEQINSGFSYLTRKQVAAKLHLSLPTLNSLTKEGTLKGYKIQRRVLYRSDEIELALEPIQSIKFKRSQ